MPYPEAKIGIIGGIGWLGIVSAEDLLDKKTKKQPFVTSATNGCTEPKAEVVCCYYSHMQP
jgi:hypothetical protein